MVGLKVLYGQDVNYKLDRMKKVSKRVEEISNFKVAVNQPIVGDNIFVRESGIGIDLVTNVPLAMFALNPAFIGNKAGIVLGKKSGLKSVEVKLNELGIIVEEDDKKAEILLNVKKEAINKKRVLNDDEFIEIVHKVMN